MHMVVFVFVQVNKYVVWLMTIHLSLAESYKPIGNGGLILWTRGQSKYFFFHGNTHYFCHQRVNYWRTLWPPPLQGRLPLNLVTHKGPGPLEATWRGAWRELACGHACRHAHRREAIAPGTCRSPRISVHRSDLSSRRMLQMYFPSLLWGWVVTCPLHTLFTTACTNTHDVTCLHSIRTLTLCCITHGYKKTAYLSLSLRTFDLKSSKLWGWCKRGHFFIVVYTIEEEGEVWLYFFMSSKRLLVLFQSLLNYIVLFSCYLIKKKV